MPYVHSDGYPPMLWYMWEKTFSTEMCWRKTYPALSPFLLVLYVKVRSFRRWLLQQIITLKKHILNSILYEIIERWSEVASGIDTQWCQAWVSYCEWFLFLSMSTFRQVSVWYSKLFTCNERYDFRKMSCIIKRKLNKFYRKKRSCDIGWLQYVISLVIRKLWQDKFLFWP